jgi:class 3 adenylate cyclase/YHS domain-containing protein
VEGTFAFVDLAGFSALTEAHGDHAAADLVERFTDLVDSALGGDAERVRTIGDAVFLVSPGPVPGLRAVQRIWERASDHESFPVLRAGLHHGQAVKRGTDYFGSAVNIAARVAAMASGAQILATAAVADAARAEGRAVTSLGPIALKNLRDRVALYPIALRDEPESEVIDPVCRMRVTPANAAARLRVGETDYYFCSTECASTFLSTKSRTE